MNIRKPLRFVVLIAIILLQVSFMASAWAADSRASSLSSVLGIPTVPPMPNTIGGVVTNEKTGALIKSVKVTLYQWNGKKWKEVKNTNTDSKGQYKFTNRPAGLYRIKFSASKYKTEYYNNASSLSNATNIVLTVGGVLNNINAALTPKK